MDLFHKVSYKDISKKIEYWDSSSVGKIKQILNIIGGYNRVWKQLLWLLCNSDF